MMARKLSDNASRPAFLWSAAIASLVASHSWAQSVQVQLPTQAKVIENLFVSTQAQTRTAADEPQTSQRPAIAYQNPFAGLSKSPPVDTSLRPGPVSRWQRPAIPGNESSPIKSAVLSTKSSALANSRWDELPPAENLRHRGSTRASEDELEFYSRLSTPPDTIRLTPRPLTQPAWLIEETDESISGQWNALAVAPAGFESPVSAVDIDAEPVRASIGAAADRREHVASAFTIDRFDPAKAAVSPDIVADCVDTPAGWLEQAQHAAAKAGSREELSAVIDLCDRGMRGEPDDEESSSLRRLAAWAHNRRGELLAESDQIDEAHNDFQVAISLDPKCSLAIHNRAVTLAQQNQFAAALRDFNRVIELNPGLAVAYRNRAELLAASGRMDDAIADFSEAIEGLPNDSEPYRGRAYAYQRLGEFKKALADLNHALEIAPDQPDALTQRGNLAAERGDFAKAMADFRRALAIDPNLADAYRSLAWLQATSPNPQFQNPQQAIAAAEQAAKLSSTDDPLILDTLAAAHASAGHFDEAVAIQQKALAAAPEELSRSLEQRLALYQHGRAFRTAAPATAVRTASHDEPADEAMPLPSQDQTR